MRSVRVSLSEYSLLQCEPFNSPCCTASPGYEPCASSFQMSVSRECRSGRIDSLSVVSTEIAGNRTRASAALADSGDRGSVSLQCRNSQGEETAEFRKIALEFGFGPFACFNWLGLQCQWRSGRSLIVAFDCRSRCGQESSALMCQAFSIRATHATLSLLCGDGRYGVGR